jgi:predicted DNA-binding transcriptional regulator AlpA
MPPLRKVDSVARRKTTKVDPAREPGGTADLAAAQAKIGVRGPDAILNGREAAAVLGASPATLADWRTRKRGPQYLRMGGVTGYRYGDLTAWLDARKVTPDAAPLRIAEAGR